MVVAGYVTATNRRDATIVDGTTSAMVYGSSSNGVTRMVRVRTVVGEVDVDPG